MSLPNIKVGVVETAQPPPSTIRAGRAQGLGNPASAQERGEVSHISLCPFLKGECKKTLCALYREDRRECSIKTFSEAIL